VQGKPFLEQMHWPLQFALQEHLMSSIKLTACGAGRARYLTEMYSRFLHYIHLLQLEEGWAAYIVMKFARI